MSKTFKSAATNRTLTVEGFFNGAFSVVFSDDSSRDLMLQGDDAPALALAILEAAGVPWNVDTPLGRAAVELDKHVTLATKATAEAKDKAELEAEALELFNTLQVEIHGSLGPNWINVTEFPNIETKRKWIAVARKSRELGGRAEK